MRAAVTQATLPAALAAVVSQGSNSGSNPRDFRGAMRGAVGANVSRTQRPGDYAWVLWTTRRDGTTEILASIFGPTIREARAFFGPQRENRAISSLLSYRTMAPLPKPPAPEDDYSRTVPQSVKVRPGRFHRPVHTKQRRSA